MIAHQAAGGEDSVTLHEIQAAPVIMASGREILVESAPEQAAAEDKVYVAVSKVVKGSELTLVQALQHFGSKICLVSVLLPPKKISMGGMGAPIRASSATDAMVRAHIEREKKNVHSILDEYLAICSRMGVEAEKQLIESDSIEKGLVEFIRSHGIKKLVMGAAADGRYFKKAQAEQAASTPDASLLSSPLVHRISSLKGQPSLPKSPSSATLRRNNTVRLTNPVQDYLRRAFSSRSSNNDKQLGKPTAPPREQQPPPKQITVLERERNYAESSKSSARSHSSRWSPFSPNSPNVLSDLSADKLSPLNFVGLPVIETDVNDDRYDQLERARAHAENAIQEAFQEGERFAKAATTETVKAFETLYMEERKQRKVIEEELGTMKDQWDKLTEALHVALDQKSLFENQIAEKDQFVKELEQKMADEAELLRSCQQERNLKVREAEELRSRLEVTLSATLPVFFSEFPLSEIKEATRNFHPSYNIGAGGYGDVYKCLLRHVPVAIKKLRTNSTQGPREFEQEVKVLSMVRHPHLVTLIGVCPEESILVYEYLAKGSLEDRLNHRGNVAPLTWQARVRIATELCSALVFLHSCKPYKIVHGDVKPANILLDDHLVSKLSDFGTCCVLSSDEHSSNNTTLLHKSSAQATMAYMDPEFISTGEVTTKFDVYSFGIILLQLLTGRAAMGITKDVQYALSRGNLKALLDGSADGWPHVQAEHLAHLGLKCCELSRRNRPDLQPDVLRVLQHMRASCD